MQKALSASRQYIHLHGDYDRMTIVNQKQQITGAMAAPVESTGSNIASTLFSQHSCLFARSSLSKMFQKIKVGKGKKSLLPSFGNNKHRLPMQVCDAPLMRWRIY